MTVYVDEFRKWGPTNIRWFRRGSCHLTADSLDELHRFAAKLGLRRSWFQGDPAHPHYDLTESKRDLALRIGAVFKGAMEQARERVASTKDRS